MSDDYDRLSELGVEQGRALGRWWVTHNVRPTHVFTGNLQRQRHTAAAVGTMFAQAQLDFPQPVQLAGLNEYDADALIRDLAPALAEVDDEIAVLQRAFTSASEQHEQYKAVHRLLEASMLRWIGDAPQVREVGMASWSEFSDGVRAAMQQTRVSQSGATVAVFTSGGPIGVAVQTALRAPQVVAAELNWRVMNAAVTQFTYSGDRLALDTFNTTPFLGADELTYR